MFSDLLDHQGSSYDHVKICVMNGHLCRHLGLFIHICINGVIQKLRSFIGNVYNKQALWVSRSDLFNHCQTGLMGILTKQVLGVFRPDRFNSYKTGDTKHDKASFKHSIEWHLKEIKRPKNLNTFCFHSSFKTNFVCCVFRPAAGCARTLRRVELLFSAIFKRLIII
jgi:hypothetical protein